jgi:hypothetical protein
MFVMHNHNLPMELISLLGREYETRVLSQLLRSAEVRLVTLILTIAIFK